MSSKYIYIFGLLAAFVIIGYVMNRGMSNGQQRHVEHFSSGVQLKECDTPVKIYDKFYSGIYDELMTSTARCQYEVLQVRENLLKKYKGSGKVSVLDIGCGLGHQVDLFNQYKYNTKGLDISPSMIELAKIKYPLLEFKVGDMTDRTLYEPTSLTHVTCFFYSIYYVEDIHNLFEGVNSWLKPGGFFVVHLVDKRKFDPVLEKSSGLIPLYNPQKHARKTKTKLKFNDFDYEADWKLEDKPVLFNEMFRFPRDKVRKNRHTLFMQPMKKYVNTAEQTGFKLRNTIDMAICNHPFNYLFCFEKVYG
jgi:SAM-dependent methyltransferase